MGIAAAGAASLPSSQLATAAARDSVRPLSVNILEAALMGLRRRLAQTRLPEKETVAD
jgi:hypothetical protein